MSAGGSIAGMMATLKENSRIKGRSTSRYKSFRNQYIGVFDKSETPYKSNLTPAQLAEGRKRAKAYYKKRNLRIYTQIAFVSILVLSIVGFFINKYLLN